MRFYLTYTWSRPKRNVLLRTHWAFIETLTAMARFRVTFQNENLENLISHFRCRWYFLSQISCFVLKNEEWGFLKTLSETILLLMYYIEKWGFWSQFFCFFYWKMRISKISFPKNVTFLCIILKNDVFEVKSYVLYWKMRISKNSFVKKFYSYVLYWKMMFSTSILLFCIEKWGMRIS